MRTFVQCSLALVGFGVILSGRALAQPVEQPEEIVVRAKPLNQYRVEIELARDEMIRLFNEANEDDDNDVRCRYEAPTGSRIPQRVCFSAAQDRASANSARDFLNALFLGTGSASQGSATGIGEAQNAAGGGSRAMVEFDKEWRSAMRGQYLYRVRATRQRCARHGQSQYLGLSGRNDWQVRARRARQGRGRHGHAAGVQRDVAER